jgi:hypothetical protein
MPTKSASQASSVNLEMSKCPNVKMSNPISGSQIRVPNQGPKSGSQIGSHITPQIGVQNRGLKLKYQIGVPNQGPKSGSKIGVPNGGVISGTHITLCLEMSKCQNDKMIKCPNVKTPIGLWSEKVRKLLQGLRAVGKNTTNICPAYWTSHFVYYLEGLVECRVPMYGRK